MRRLLTPSTIVPCAIIAAVGAMVVSANIRKGRSNERPFTSAAPLGVAGAPSTSRDGLARRINEMEGRIKTNPDDVRAAVLLADALIRQSRVTGNVGLTIRAAQVLRTVLRNAPDNYDGLHEQSTLYLSQHKFSEAIAVAEKLRTLRPEDPTNYGVIGDGHLELGDYTEAFAAFDRMMQLRPNAASYARVAYARELQGDLTGALESMKLAAEASVGGDVEGTAWYQSQVGELYLRLNQPSEAMAAFIAASQAFPGHPFAVAGYAKALDRAGRHDEARSLLEDLATKAPTPDVYAHLGDLYAAAGRADAAERNYALAEAAWRSDAPEPKNLARFLAERGRKVEEAVSIAEGAAAARHDIFTEDALAWAYFKAGRTEDAKHAIARALRTGTKDADILRHAAAIGASPSQMARNNLESARASQ